MTEVRDELGAQLVRTTVPMGGRPQVPDWWEPLRAQAGQVSAWLSRDWLQQWLDTFGEAFVGDWVQWTDGERTVAGCLLLSGTIRRGGVRLSALFVNVADVTAERAPMAEFNLPPCVPGYETAVGRDLGRSIASRAWQVLSFPGHEGGPLVDAMMAELPALRIDDDARAAPYVDLSTLTGSVVDGLSRNSRQNLRRMMRLYAKRDGELAIRAATDADEAHRWIDELAALHNQTWAARGRQGAFEHASYCGFAHRLIDTTFAQGTVEVLRATAGDRTVGLLFNLVAGRKICFVQSGFAYETEDHRLQPGMVTITLAIDHYLARGMEEFDFLAGDAQYKRVFAGHERTLHWTRVWRASPGMRVALGVDALARRITGNRRGFVAALSAAAAAWATTELITGP